MFGFTQARVESTHEVLEIGSGWGALAIQLVRRTGCRYTGITLSEEQLLYAQARVKEAHLEVCYFLQDSIFFLPGCFVNNRVIFTKSMGLSLGVSPYVFPLDFFTYRFLFIYLLLLFLCCLHLWCMLTLLRGTVVLESEWRATYFRSFRAKLMLAPLGMAKWVWPLMDRYRMFFIQSSTLPLSVHQKFTEHERCCMQNYLLLTKTQVELKGNWNTSLSMWLYMLVTCTGSSWHKSDSISKLKNVNWVINLDVVKFLICDFDFCRRIKSHSNSWIIGMCEVIISTTVSFHGTIPSSQSSGHLRNNVY